MHSTQQPAASSQNKTNSQEQVLKCLSSSLCSSVCFVLAAWCLLLGAGCTALTRIEHPRAARADGHTQTPRSDGYRDYVGALHIHTNYSHDAHGKFEDVVRVANGQRLDYVIVTEHNNLRLLKEGKQGLHGTTLVLIGMEISTRGGHYLSFNVNEEIDRSKFTTQQIIDEVTRQGGFGFIAHPYFKNGRWRDWSVTGFTGVEAYNVAHDTLDENKMRLALWTLSAPVEPFYLSILDRPYDPLAKWDELIKQHGKVVGIGATDAHEFHALGLVFAPYEIMFQMVRTHVLVPMNTAFDKDAVYDALRNGHAYLSIELLAEAKGFTFMADRDGQVVGIMGDEVALEPGLRLTAAVPMPGHMILFRDGQPVATTAETLWHFDVTEPGAYRLEVVRQGKPWIYSNPIYVRSSDVSAPSTQHPAEEQQATAPSANGEPAPAATNATQPAAEDRAQKTDEPTEQPTAPSP